MIIITNYDKVKKISALYFLLGMSEVCAEYYSWKPAIIVLKPMIPLMLMLMYRKTSKRSHPLFFLTLLFSFFTNLMFLPDGKGFLLYAVMVFTIHRILLNYYIIRILKIKDFIPVAIGFVPFFFMFSYIFKFAGDVTPGMYVLIIIQNVLISLFGGISLSNYIMNDNSKNSWLYMSGLLFVLLQFVVFIERYYLLISIFRPIAMLLNVCAFYCFYHFVISTENSNYN